MCRIHKSNETVLGFCALVNFPATRTHTIFNSPMFYDGIFVGAWDSHSVEWDSPLEQAEIISAQVLLWDSIVSELNIYYYILTGPHKSSRIPPRSKSERKSR